MCLLVFAWKTHSSYPLVLAGNRDEFHDRPAAAADWWAESPGVLAGKDLEAGGTWLGVSASGRFAVVTNYREPATSTSGRRSRGELVTDFLTQEEPIQPWATGLAARQDQYGGYNLIVGDRTCAHYLTNRGADVHGLAPGIYGLSNHRLDTSWPKVTAARGGLREVLDGKSLASTALFRILADRQQAADEDLPETGVPIEWERLLSSAFIVSPRYGTRVSTVVLMGADGTTEFEERRFDANGDCVGETRYVVGATAG